MINVKKRYCVNCGKEIIPGAKFCVNCGSQNITDNINNISKDLKPQASIDPFDDISEDDFFSSDNEFDVDESIFFPEHEETPADKQQATSLNNLLDEGTVGQSTTKLVETAVEETREQTDEIPVEDTEEPQFHRTRKRERTESIETAISELDYADEKVEKEEPSPNALEDIPVGADDGRKKIEVSNKRRKRIRNYEEIDSYKLEQDLSKIKESDYDGYYEDILPIDYDRDIKKGGTSKVIIRAAGVVVGFIAVATVFIKVMDSLGFWPF